MKDNFYLSPHLGHIVIIVLHFKQNMESNLIPKNEKDSRPYQLYQVQAHITLQ